MRDGKQTPRLFWTRLMIAVALAAGMMFPESDLEAGNVKGGLRITSIIDQTVRNSKGQELGEIEDLIIRRNGKVKRVIISLDGFLGIVDKNVTAPFRTLKIDNAEKIVYDITREQLEDQPDFDYRKHGLYTDYYYRPYLPDMSGGPRGPYAPEYGPHSWQNNWDYPYYPYSGSPARWYGYPPYGRMPEDFRGPYSDSAHPWEAAYFPGRMLGSLLLDRIVINKQGEAVAKVKDLILDSNNKIETIIMSVTGFPGIDDKLAAVPYKPIGFTRFGIAYDISRKALEDTPAFNYNN